MNIYTLFALKSAVESRRFNSILQLVSKISDIYLKRKILNEMTRNNYGNVTTIIDLYIFENFQHIKTYEFNDIKQFDFEEIDDCNFNKIKNELDLPELNFYNLKNLDGEDSGFYRYWNNLNRFSVLCRKELFNEIKENPEYLLFLEKEIKEGKLGFYTKFTIYSQEYINNLREDRVTDRSHMGEYRDWHMDAYENDASNLWNTD